MAEAGVEKPQSVLQQVWGLIMVLFIGGFVKSIIDSFAQQKQAEIDNAIPAHSPSLSLDANNNYNIGEDANNQPHKATFSTSTSAEPEPARAVESNQSNRPVTPPRTRASIAPNNAKPTPFAFRGTFRDASRSRRA